MKVHIAICDDEKVETEYLTKLVWEWAAHAKINASVSSFDSAEAFLFAYETDKSVDVLLLDIKMKQLDGVALAKRLRADGEQMQIVFITGLSGYMADGYDVSALHYLMKPVNEERLFAVLDKALKMLDKTDDFVLLETEDAQTRVFCREIYYAEAFARSTTIHTAGGDMETRLFIGELEKMLGGEFFRVHRSYLVGLRHIRHITKTNVVLDNGSVIPLSRRRYGAANHAFIQYYKVMSNNP